MTDDEKYIKKCIELSAEAIAKGDQPFGSIIVKNGEIIASVANDMKNKVNYHAEILALNKAAELLGTNNLKDCILYSNCEPCPMCSFMIREYKIKKVVFSLPSPFMGGYSKWQILQDQGLADFSPFFAEPPEVVGGILEAEAKEVFDQTPLWMFGSNPKKR